jgi:DNA-binding FadR family transcriptional regulator
MFRPIRTRRTFEEAVAQLADAIRFGDVKVGDRLPSERDLASMMEISRPTLREAIKVLADLGVVEVIPSAGGGMFVRSDRVPLDLVHQRSEMRMSEVAAVLETRRLLEPRVAQLAALNATDDDFEAMRKTIDLHRQCDGRDRQRMTQLDLRFHLCMARSTGNPTVVRLMRVLLGELELARDMSVTGTHGLEEVIAIHEHTLRAIMGGRPESIEEAMDEHLSFLERVWEEETGKARIRRVPDFLLPRLDRVAAQPPGA